jgi:hypothetical protein
MCRSLRRVDRERGAVIIVKLFGGLGNQMHQYAFGRSLSIRSMRRLVLDASGFPSGLGRHQRVYRLSELRINPRTRVVHGNDRRQRLHRSFIHRIEARGSYVVEDDTNPPHAPLISGRVTLYSGYWQSHTYIEDISDSLIEEFRLGRPLSKSARELVEILESPDSVAVHVRRGDYAELPETMKIHGLLTPAYYHQAVSEIFAQTGSRGPVVVFSDDPTWASENLEFTADTVHAELNGALADVEMLDVFRSAHHHVIANSSLSWWGAWLSRREGQRVIAPEAWFAGRPNRFPEQHPSNWLLR